MSASASLASSKRIGAFQVRRKRRLPCGLLIRKDNPWANTMNAQSAKESLGSQQDREAAAGLQPRIQTLDAAITHLTGLPGYAAMELRLRSECDPLIAEMENASCPRLEAFSWLDLNATHFLSLVTDLPSWDSYRIFVREGLYPQSYTLLFGLPNVVPASTATRKLETRLRLRLRYWFQRSSEKLADYEGQGRRIHPTALARNLDRLRLECGWSYGDLGKATNFDGKTIIRHIMHGKKAYPTTLNTYARAFTLRLGRKVTARWTVRFRKALAPNAAAVLQKLGQVRESCETAKKTSSSVPGLSACQALSVPRATCRDDRELNVSARLKPGNTLQQARMSRYSR
jgi:hypothetical protein